MCLHHRPTREAPMGQRHPSTAAQRAGWVSQLIAHAGEYGLVTQLSRSSGVSRQSLSAWRALGLAAHAPASSRTLALDEVYGNDRRGAYLSVVDTASGAVWAAEGPLPVDQESWTLLLWELQARGLRWRATVHDGGSAIQAACAAVDPQGQHGRDVWHVLHRCAQVQGRLDRRVAQEQARAATLARR